MADHILYPLQKIRATRGKATQGVAPGWIIQPRWGFGVVECAGKYFCKKKAMALECDNTLSLSTGGNMFPPIVRCLFARP
jgi:hypothetical protein